MAIAGVRVSTVQGAPPSGVKTTAIWWLSNGTVSLESHRNVGASNNSSAVLGIGLDITGAYDKSRAPALATNARFLSS